MTYNGCWKRTTARRKDDTQRNGKADRQSQSWDVARPPSLSVVPVQQGMLLPERMRIVPFPCLFSEMVFSASHFQKVWA